MSASYNQINYSLRPAKHIERKMLAEAFQRLSVFAKLSSYKYIGFGSIYFTDFILFHRLIGITDMLSIEKDLGNKSRFEFNCPFKCVKLDFRHSNEVLPELAWIKKTILWLDYDGKLNQESLSDIAAFFASAPSGSAFVISINSEFDKFGENSFQQFEDSVGKENIPIGVGIKDMRGNGSAQVLRQIIINQIEKTLSYRNGVLLPKNQLKFEQLFNFQYADGAKMLTVGGILFKNSREAILKKSDPWGDIEFIRRSDEPYVIDAPCLTLKEIRYLESLLPIGTEKQKKYPLIPKEQHKKYSKVYRYYPMYAAAEL